MDSTRPIEGVVATPLCRIGYDHDMITARSPIGVLRARIFRGPLRMLWLTLLTIGLVYAHGASAESSPHHSTGASTPVLSTSHAPADSREISYGETQSSKADELAEDSSTHPAEQCMPGQSQQGAAVQVLCSGVLSHRSCHGRALQQSPLTANRVDRPASAIPSGPAVLRI